MVRVVEDLQLRKFNDQGEFDCDVDPGVVFESLQAFNEESFASKMRLEVVVKEGVPRSILMEVKEADCDNILNEDKEVETEKTEDDESIRVKVKFFKAANDVEGRTRVRFTRKFGDIVNWTRLFTKMRGSHLDDVLLLPREHIVRNSPVAEDKEVVAVNTTQIVPAVDGS